MKNMKKVITIIICIFCLNMVSCDFLDKRPDDQLTMEMVFNNADNTRAWLSGIYNVIPDPLWDYSSYAYGYSMMCDEAHMASALGVFGWGYLMNVQQGSWTPTVLVPAKNIWNETYQKVRSALIFLENVKAIPDQRLTSNMVENYKCEARFLIAYYYSRMLEVYGPFPLVKDITEVESVGLSTVPLMKERTPYDEIVDYLDKELLELSELLPVKYEEVTDEGRPTKGMCLAVRARMLLFAASPLFNGNKDYANIVNANGTHLFNQTYDREKWKKAIDATKLVIDMPEYELYKEYNGDGSIDALMSCMNVHLTGVQYNKEIIFPFPKKTDWQYEYHILPRGSGWAGCLAATQNLVDAFFMKNGLSINDDGSGYKATGFSTQDVAYKTKYRYASAANQEGVVTKAGTFNMYVNREPRFYVNIGYHGQYCSFDKSNRTINFLNGGNDGKPSHDSPITGYQFRKAVNPTVQHGVGYPYKPGIIIRLAEMYLNYAEALTEYDYEANKNEAQKYVNFIRERGGLPNLESSLSREEMIDAIIKERRVEFAFEGGMRYMDLRRWKLMGKVLSSSPIKGMNVEAKTNSDYFKIVEIQQRVFSEKMYLWPIYQTYMDNNSKLVQNKGY